MRTITRIILIFALLSSSVAMANDKPNILVIFTDDVGIWNVNAYDRR